MHHGAVQRSVPSLDESFQFRQTSTMDVPLTLSDDTVSPDWRATGVIVCVKIAMLVHQVAALAARIQALEPRPAEFRDR